MNVFYNLFVRVGTALLSAFWIFLGMTIVSIIKIKSQNLTDEFKEFKMNNKGPLAHIRFLYRDNKKLFIFTWSFIVIAMLVASFVAFDNQKYYDMRGNAYKDQYQVVFYTESGEEYVLLEDEYAFVQMDKPENVKSGFDSYLDQKGYLIFISADDIEYDENAPDYEPYCYYDTDSNRYASTLGAYWDKDGGLYFISQDREKMNELVEKLNNLLKEQNHD